MQRCFGRSARTIRDGLGRGRAPSGSLALVALAAVMASSWWIRLPASPLPPLATTAWIDPSTAPVESLRLLPGIGPALAARIDQARRDGLDLHRAEDLTQVPGIGPRRVESMRPLLRAVPPTPPNGALDDPMSPSMSETGSTP